MAARASASQNIPSKAAPATPGASTQGVPDDLEDLKLVERTIAGDKSAFEELFVKYRQRLYGVAWRLLHEEDSALDVVQDAFVKAYSRIGDLRGEARFYPWLRRIAVNLAIDRLRKLKREAEVGFDEAHYGAGDDTDTDRSAGSPGEKQERSNPLYHVELAEFSEDLKTALEKISPPHRAVFMLHAAEGMTYREIADALKCNIGTVMSRLFYARKRLQELLAPHLADIKPGRDEDEELEEEQDE